uniref:AlNc14C253G9678 protein n=1 Tax=Albugo laibachii Nc14 TaxID=890382 RepID=F0WTJ9_9STRA|nr:AlNc14C253G9678 [Albugo laibachii Nc14]|eukprot:CCA24690.1 AlNc14C253G9678 [Albugo laibachii Nc14]
MSIVVLRFFCLRTGSGGRVRIAFWTVATTLGKRTSQDALPKSTFTPPDRLLNDGAATLADDCFERLEHGHVKRLKEKFTDSEKQLPIKSYYEEEYNDKKVLQNLTIFTFVEELSKIKMTGF